VSGLFDAAQVPLALMGLLPVDPGRSLRPRWKAPSSPSWDGENLQSRSAVSSREAHAH
jgi:hypothetical protein